MSLIEIEQFYHIYKDVDVAFSAYIAYLKHQGIFISVEYVNMIYEELKTEEEATIV